MMTLAVKTTLTASGLFLLTGMLVGVLKYRFMMRSPEHRAPAYIDIGHRAALLYSFAALVMARLLESSPFPTGWQMVIALAPLIYFALTIIQYVRLGLAGREETQFAERNFITTWFMYGLIAGEIGGLAAIVGGFIYSVWWA
jgi:hypothetical protein